MRDHHFIWYINADDDATVLSTCRLEYGNGVYYPETEYDTESKVKIYNDLMSYAWRKKWLQLWYSS